MAGALEDRVGALEHGSSWAKWGGLAGLAALFFGGRGGGTPKVVKAEAFALVDGSGKSRVVLGLAPDGTVGLGFFDAQDRCRLALGLDPDGTPLITATDEEGRERDLIPSRR